LSINFSGKQGTERVVGVVGGMGPEATADFYLKLLAITPASRDQDHLRVIIDSNAKVPDRVAAILGEGESPVLILQSMARGLQSLGADLLVIPCNTAHYYYEDVQSAVTIPVLHMQKAVVASIQRTAADHPNLDYSRVGLLATTATLHTKLYQIYAEEAGIVIIVPNAVTQEQFVTAGIKAVKAGDRSTGRRLIHQAAKELIDNGAQVIIAGCTEIPLVLADGDISVSVIDSTEVLAEATLRAAMGSLSERR